LSMRRMTLPRAPASWLTNTVPGPPDVVLDPQNVILGLDPRIGSRVHIARLLAFLGVSGDPRVEPEDDGKRRTFSSPVAILMPMGGALVVSRTKPRRFP